MIALMDHETDKAWVKSLKKKDEVPEKGLKFIDELVGKGKGPPAFLRMDRASENGRMVESIKLKHPKVQIEFTSNNSPQQNGKVESNLLQQCGMG